jgi:4-hydroxybenzoyl-CoA reductase subunit beta
MLRLQEYRYHRPTRLAQALELLHGREDAMPIAGGTDLIPNMKHRLWTPNHLVGLKAVEEMRGVRFLDPEGNPVAEDDPTAAFLAIGAGETLADVAAHPRVRGAFPSLAAAAGMVAGPQIRNQGTIGGNLCLDTRCTYYNQSLFWRQALGFCLKKDGEVCHVTKVGRKCVAAHSADTPPVLITLAAQVAEDGAVEGMSLVVSALGSRPRMVSGLEKIAVGKPLGEVMEGVAQQAYKQCHPLETLIVDPDWRRAMVPVYVRRALQETSA